MKEILAKLLGRVLRQVILCLFKLYTKCRMVKERDCGKDIDHEKGRN